MGGQAATQPGVPAVAEPVHPGIAKFRPSTNIEDIRGQTDSTSIRPNDKQMMMTAALQRVMDSRTQHADLGGVGEFGRQQNADIGAYAARMQAQREAMKQEAGAVMSNPTLALPPRRPTYMLPPGMTEEPPMGGMVYMPESGHWAAPPGAEVIDENSPEGQEMQRQDQLGLMQQRAPVAPSTSGFQRLPEPSGFRRMVDPDGSVTMVRAGSPADDREDWFAWQQGGAFPGARAAAPAQTRAAYDNLMRDYRENTRR